ncbi:hypothetical protein SSABA_v1c01170 [Spiroplasma sabaudiense Ar-1343]|uniref:Transmembrane protein n=1 Tax=Spiroplasma sabaudiense Ar-1343 TaxID=1276257 RepID=W6AIJ6_9MOLU|nr:hypothetical protein [Spiroplasma sabaudiense]AHI53529.1 hypothetical protein SSABA_v1c01170 [Spiroplasma sabaudiense Ar-1343]
MKRNYFKKMFYLNFVLLHLTILIATTLNIFFPNQETIFVVQVSLTISLIQTLLLFLAYLSYKLICNWKVVIERAVSLNFSRKEKPSELKKILQIVLPSFLIIQGETSAIMNETMKGTFFASVYSFVLVSFLTLLLFAIIMAMISFKDLKSNHIIKRIIKTIKRLKNILLSFFKKSNVKVFQADNKIAYNLTVEIFLNRNSNFFVTQFNYIKTEQLNNLKKALDFRAPSL